MTAGTNNKKHYFRHRDSLDYVQKELLAKAMQYDWQIEAWAVFSNHYHFVGHALRDSKSMGPMLNHFRARFGFLECDRHDGALDPARLAVYLLVVSSTIQLPKTNRGFPRPGTRSK